MSLYQVNKLIYSIVKDPDLLNTFRSDPDKVLKKFDLNSKENAALKVLNPQRLAQMGVHPILLIWCHQLQQPPRERPKETES